MFLETLSERDRIRVGWLGVARAEDTRGTPIQSHISPIKLVYEEYIPSETRTSGLAWQQD